MFKYVLFYVTVIWLLDSYMKVNSTGNNLQCTPDKNYPMFEKSSFLEMCNLPQAEFEEKFNTEFMNVTKRRLYTRELMNVLMVPNYDILGCFDENKINFIKNEISIKLSENLKTESLAFQYFFHFLKFINSIIGVVFLVFGLLTSLLIFCANYIVFEGVNFILMTK